MTTTMKNNIAYVLNSKHFIIIVFGNQTSTTVKLNLKKLSKRISACAVPLLSVTITATYQLIWTLINHHARRL